MADIRIGAELGMKNVMRGVIKKFQPSENPASLAGRQVTDRDYYENKKLEMAITPGQNHDNYKIVGNVVNKTA